MRGQHEHTYMNPKYVVYFAVALVIAAVVIHVGVWWMFRQLVQEQARRDRQPVLVNVPPPVPEPRLQISPQGDLEQLRREEDEILSTYRWVDRDKGIARIPIDRAMQVFIQKQKK